MSTSLVSTDLDKPLRLKKDVVGIWQFPLKLLRKSTQISFIEDQNAYRNDQDMQSSQAKLEPCGNDAKQLFRKLEIRYRMRKV